ncbi:MAG: aminopeptidase P family protein [Euryarchaeota archaeon]|jgi:Xaa-Pro aminopeptidase|nr:aminopeptidase P family protein [Euryarchaeota archaeon]
MSSWSTEDLLGPEGEDWRVPVSELEQRITKLANSLQENNLPGALIQSPVDLYYYAGGRQNGALYIPATGSKASTDSGGEGSTFFVRRSIKRAEFEAGGTDAPFAINTFPSLRVLAETLSNMGAEASPALQKGELPADFHEKFASVLAPLGTTADCTQLIHSQREVKSSWELSMMREGALVQQAMFDSVRKEIAAGKTELELVAAAEAISRERGFGGNVQMRRFPLQCDRAVIVSGRSGGVPSFFDSAIGGSGAHPLAGMGSGFNKIREKQPILVDLVHVHRGYVVDATRMFSVGNLDETWLERLDSMVEVSDAVVNSLGRGDDCSEAWEIGSQLATSMGHSEHLMGMNPDQSKFLGHSVGLQLDESPVVAKGFDRPLPNNGVMAIEPKLVFAEGSIGIEDTWLKTENGLERLTLTGNTEWLTNC